VAESRARSSQANTHTVAMPSNPTSASVAKNRSQSTSPCPTEYGSHVYRASRYSFELNLSAG
jgi:hypothetical protein